MALLGLKQLKLFKLEASIISIRIPYCTHPHTHMHTTSNHSYDLHFMPSFHPLFPLLAPYPPQSSAGLIWQCLHCDQWTSWLQASVCGHDQYPAGCQWHQCKLFKQCWPKENRSVPLCPPPQVHTCPTAMGYSFAAGTTDGPGAFNFEQGEYIH